MTMDLVKKAKALSPTVQIGKSGLSESQIAELKKQLKKRKLVKVKMLRSFVLTVDSRQELDEIPNVVAGLTGSEVLHAVGNTFVLLQPLSEK